MNNKTVADLKVGDTIWVFDQNRRVYEDRHSSPIWIKHWRPCKITGETARSFIVDGDRGWRAWKLAKKGGIKLPAHCSAVAFDHAGISWYHLREHRWKLAETVRRVDDIETLCQIAAIVGFEWGVDISDIDKA